MRKAAKQAARETERGIYFHAGMAFTVNNDAAL